MRLKRKFALALAATAPAAAFVLGATSPAAGDVLLIDSVEDAALRVPKRPARGVTMASVEREFGAPARREGPVGEPPITRWDYADFSVYFEHDRVIHAVANR